MDERAPQKTEPKHVMAGSISEHFIRDEADFNRHIDYIHRDPMKHGYVARVSHWAYSSFHR
jgi:REP element-mobilizing transposase RayT